MSLLRRRSMPGIWLAVLAYLCMFGLDEVHAHYQSTTQPGLPASRLITRITPDSTCPMCHWHVMAVASYALVYAPPLIEHAFSLSDAIAACHLFIVTPATRSRAPPYCNCVDL